MTKTYLRGWEVYFDGSDWRYTDTNEIFNDSKPCKRCGKYPTKEGYDACVGHIEGATSACCGHGITERYVKYGKKEDDGDE